MRHLVLFLCMALCSAGISAHPIAIVGARVVTLGPGGDLSEGIVLIRDGIVAEVGTSVKIPADATIVDARGRIVTPGFLISNGSVGMSDVLDEDELSPTGPMGAANDMAFSFNPLNDLVRTHLLEGETAAVLVPRVSAASVKEGKPFGGKAAVVELSGNMDFLVKSNVANIIDVKTSQALGGRAAFFPLIAKLLNDARLAANTPENKAGSKPGSDTSAALEPILAGKEILLVAVERASDIVAVLRLCREQNLRIALLGAAEGWLVANEIAAAHVPVLLAADLNTPLTFEQINATYQNAQRLASAGVEIAIIPSETYPSARALRLVAGSAVAYGLDYQTALRGITVTPARIFGVDDRMGSIEVGKRADLVIWSGDPLEVSSFAEQVYVRGVEVPLVNHETSLRDKYRNATQ